MQNVNASWNGEYKKWIRYFIVSSSYKTTGVNDLLGIPMYKSIFDLESDLGCNDDWYGEMLDPSQVLQTQVWKL